MKQILELLFLIFPFLIICLFLGILEKEHQKVVKGLK